jgi:hypothetical protein
MSDEAPYKSPVTEADYERYKETVSERGVGELNLEDCKMKLSLAVILIAEAASHWRFGRYGTDEMMESIRLLGHVLGQFREP